VGAALLKAAAPERKKKKGRFHFPKWEGEGDDDLERNHGCGVGKDSDKPLQKRNDNRLVDEGGPDLRIEKEAEEKEKRGVSLELESKEYSACFPFVRKKE